MKTTNSYTAFAQVYDLFMKDVPYDDWVEYIEKIWTKFNVKPELVLELACGTGNITKRLHQKGYDMIGIDNSADMLSVAKDKCPEILFLNQDMCEFELYGTVDSIICLCDGINYLLEDGDLEKTFSLVKNYLNPGGLFIFDLNTEYKFSEILADNTFAENTENASFIWENYYYEDEKINEYSTSFFVKTTGNSYVRFDETHEERAYSINEICDALAVSGLEFIGVFDEASFKKPSKKSERIYFVAKK